MTDRVVIYVCCVNRNRRVRETCVDGESLLDDLLSLSGGVGVFSVLSEFRFGPFIPSIVLTPPFFRWIQTTLDSRRLGTTSSPRG